MFPWPVFKVSGPRGRARAQETGTGRKTPGAQAPKAPVGLVEGGKLEPWKRGTWKGKGTVPDLGAEGGDGMWGPAHKRSKQARQEATQHEERAAGPAALQNWHHIIAAQPTASRLVCKPASKQAWCAKGGPLAPSASITGGRPGQTTQTRPPHVREGNE